MVDAVAICCRVPAHFERFLQPKYSWRVMSLKKVGIVYVLNKGAIRYEYRPTHGRVWCRFNASTLVHGDNGSLLHQDDWPLVVMKVHEDLRRTFAWISPDPLRWTVSQIEYPQHMQVKASQKAMWLQWIAQLRVPYLCANTKYTHVGTTYQENRSRQLIVYDKGQQMKKTSHAPLPELENALRLEMRYRSSRALQRQLRRCSGGQVSATLEVATSPDWVSYVQRELRSIVEQIALAPTIDEARAIMVRAGWKKAKTNHHLAWMLEVARQGVSAVFAKDKQAFYRRRRTLADIGLSIYLASELNPPVWKEAQRSGAGRSVA